jgi:hypothetical protein
VKARACLNIHRPHQHLSPTTGTVSQLPSPTDKQSSTPSTCGACISQSIMTNTQPSTHPLVPSGPATLVQVSVTPAIVLYHPNKELQSPNRLSTINTFNAIHSSNGRSNITVTAVSPTARPQPSQKPFAIKKEEGLFQESSLLAELFLDLELPWL